MSYDFLTNYDTHAQFLHPNSTYDEKESWHNTENEAKKFDPFEINLTDNVQDNYYIYENDSDKELNCFQCLNGKNKHLTFISGKFNEPL